MHRPGEGKGRHRPWRIHFAKDGGHLGLDAADAFGVCNVGDEAAVFSKMPRAQEFGDLRDELKFFCVVHVQKISAGSPVRRLQIRRKQLPRPSNSTVYIEGVIRCVTLVSSTRCCSDAPPACIAIFCRAGVTSGSARDRAGR